MDHSGVATLKKYFDGTIIPENPRITNAQKSHPYQRHRKRREDCTSPYHVWNVGGTSLLEITSVTKPSLGLMSFWQAQNGLTSLLKNFTWPTIQTIKIHTTVGLKWEWTQVTWFQSRTTSGKSVRDLLDLIQKSSFDRGEAFDPENIGLRLLAED